MLENNNKLFHSFIVEKSLLWYLLKIHVVLYIIRFEYINLSLELKTGYLLVPCLLIVLSFLYDYHGNTYPVLRIVLVTMSV